MTRGGKHSLFQKLVAKTHARPLFLCNFNIAESYKKKQKKYMLVLYNFHKKMFGVSTCILLILIYSCTALQKA